MMTHNTAPSSLRAKSQTSSKNIHPRFDPNQQVHFLGGMGTIKSCRFDSGTWTYAIEMPICAEPAIGRIGAETIVLLPEIELQAA